MFEPLEERRLLAVVAGLADSTPSPVIGSPGGPRLLAEASSFIGPMPVGPTVVAPTELAAADIGSTPSTAAGSLQLVDATGAPLAFSPDGNTLVIGAATWCSACAQFKTLLNAQLATPEAAGQLAGLRIVFAFGDEGGTGPGGVLRAEFLNDLPGEVAFLAETSVSPTRFPSAFNPQTGEFDRHAADAIGEWLAGEAAIDNGALSATSTSNESAPSCGCGSKAGGASQKSSEAPLPLAALAAPLAPQPGPAALASSTPGGGSVELIDNGLTFDLVWTGTTGDDHVYFQQLDPTTIRVSLTLENGVASNYVEDFTGVTGMVKGYALAGSDILDATQLTTTAATLDGGIGNNTLYGGAANDTLVGGGNFGPQVNGPEGQQGSNILVGGDGDDTLYGNAINGAEGMGGNNLLLGGAGQDTLYGNWTNGGEGGGRNILVGGADSDTLYDYQTADGAEGQGSILIADETALGASDLQVVLAEWSSTRPYSVRIENLLGTGVGPRNNADNFLQAGVTLAADAAVDQLWGSSEGGLNWYWLDFSQDQRPRAQAGETFTSSDLLAPEAPGAFAITGPAAYLTDDDILITWEPSAEATSYEVILWDNNDLSAPFYTQVVTGTEHGVNDLGTWPEPRTIFIDVRAHNAFGSQLASNGLYEVVIEVPDSRQTLFVTDLLYAIEDVEIIPPPPQFFGSALAADYHCTIQANLAGLLDEPWDGTTIHSKAVLTVDFADLVQRAGLGDLGFVNVLGDEIAADRAQLLSGNFTAPILTQTGQLVVGDSPVWTGATATGEWSGHTANNWTDPLFSVATVGNVNGAGTAWLSNGEISSDNMARLYCTMAY